MGTDSVGVGVVVAVAVVAMWQWQWFQRRSRWRSRGEVIYDKRASSGRNEFRNDKKIPGEISLGKTV